MLKNNYMFRKVQTESSTGSSSSYKVRTTLTICVENIDFDTQACVLRLKGRNIEENKYVKVHKNYFNSLFIINIFESKFHKNYCLIEDWSISHFRC